MELGSCQEAGHGPDLGQSSHQQADEMTAPTLTGLLQATDRVRGPSETSPAWLLREG